MPGNRAAIVGAVQWPNVKVPEQDQFWTEAAADLAADVLADAGVTLDEVDGLFIPPVTEFPLIAPVAGAVEYLGLKVNMGEIVDMGGATGAGAVWRAAMAIQAGVCEVALILFPAERTPMKPGEERGSFAFPVYIGGNYWGAPASLYDFPSGMVGAIPCFSQLYSRYLHQYGKDKEVMIAKIAAEQRYNAQGTDWALFKDRPLTVDQVMRSPILCDPLRLPEVVAPCYGGGAVLMMSEERAAKQKKLRPVYVTGYAEHIPRKSFVYAPDLLETPLKIASGRALKMAGVTHKDFDFAEFYDCFTVVVALSAENAGFCKPGQGAEWLNERNTRYDGDFPVNPAGGQLGAGQPNLAGGFSLITDAVMQMQGRATGHQVKKADKAFVNGTGGLMAEQVALVLEAA